MEYKVALAWTIAASVCLAISIIVRLLKEPILDILFKYGGAMSDSGEVVSALQLDKASQHRLVIKYCKAINRITNFLLIISAIIILRVGIGIFLGR